MQENQNQKSNSYPNAAEEAVSASGPR